jgi:hypothetical protein
VGEKVKSNVEKCVGEIPSHKNSSSTIDALHFGQKINSYIYIYIHTHVCTHMGLATLDPSFFFSFFFFSFFQFLFLKKLLFLINF